MFNIFGNKKTNFKYESINNDYLNLVPSSVYKYFPIRPTDEITKEHNEVLQKVQKKYKKPWFSGNSFNIYYKMDGSYVDAASEGANKLVEFCKKRHELDYLKKVYGFPLVLMRFLNLMLYILIILL